MKRFIVVAIAMLVFSYVSSLQFEAEEPWGGETNIVIEYTDEDIRLYEKERRVLEMQTLGLDSGDGL